MPIVKKLHLSSLSVIIVMQIQIVSATESIDLLLQEYQSTATQPFSAKVGGMLWTNEINNRSCSTCHSASVKNMGKHKRTGKIIKPMSPTVNPNRLTDSKKIKKWLLRNCKWTFGRECTVQEKGDLLLWLSQQ